MGFEVGASKREKEINASCLIKKRKTRKISKVVPELAAEILYIFKIIKCCRH
jgi:hypothetical protein